MEIEDTLYSTYQKFTDLEIANEVADQLRAGGIEVTIQENNKSSVGNFAATAIDFDAAINLKPSDFEKADKLLEDYYSKLIENVEQDYYLFQFTREELHEVVANPYDWGHFDIQLAKKLLAEKGETINSETIRQNRLIQINQAAKTQKVSKAKVLTGYILSFVFPLIGFVIGYSILNNRKVLPNGQVFNLHDTADRNHGKQILTISIVWFVILITIRLLTLLS